MNYLLLTKKCQGTACIELRRLKVTQKRNSF